MQFAIAHQNVADHPQDRAAEVERHDGKAGEQADASKAPHRFEINASPEVFRVQCKPSADPCNADAHGRPAVDLCWLFRNPRALRSMREKRRTGGFAASPQPPAPPESNKGTVRDPLRCAPMGRDRARIDQRFSMWCGYCCGFDVLSEPRQARATRFFALDG